MPCSSKVRLKLRQFRCNHFVISAQQIVDGVEWHLFDRQFIKTDFYDGVTI